eukprot:TRINITY_DN54276_c0_g1_i1.p2 TRINITY_DN54276_c0_g1~~TRINITY_DN54276_c0_g1_i1.p2  ORF type:complete len:479 (-),score=80.84 TRINITY_DN54276_c0_g1_i1:2508-3944(-)
MLSRTTIRRLLNANVAGSPTRIRRRRKEQPVDIAKWMADHKQEIAAVREVYRQPFIATWVMPMFTKWPQKVNPNNWKWVKKRIYKQPVTQEQSEAEIERERKGAEMMRRYHLGEEVCRVIKLKELRFTEEVEKPDEFATRIGDFKLQDFFNKGAGYFPDLTVTVVPDNHPDIVAMKQAFQEEAIQLSKQIEAEIAQEAQERQLAAANETAPSTDPTTTTESPQPSAAESSTSGTDSATTTTTTTEPPQDTSSQNTQTEQQEGTPGASSETPNAQQNTSTEDNTTTTTTTTPTTTPATVPQEDDEWEYEDIAPKNYLLLTKTSQLLVPESITAEDFREMLRDIGKDASNMQMGREKINAELNEKRGQVVGRLRLNDLDSTKITDTQLKYTLEVILKSPLLYQKYLHGTRLRIDPDIQNPRIIEEKGNPCVLFPATLERNVFEMHMHKPWMRAESIWRVCQNFKVAIFLLFVLIIGDIDW